MTRPLMVSAALATMLVASGCGSPSSSGPSITVGAARTYQVSGFQPAGAITANKPTTVAFTIMQPDGRPLTSYRRGTGPHTGVHLIFVRSDLGAIIHRHLPIDRGGRLRDRIVFPTPGRYRVVIDAYPQASGNQPNFQLFRTITVAGKPPARPLPPPVSAQTVDGYRVTLHGRPRLRAIEPAFLTITVTATDGKPASFTPYYGALAHAIFFRKGSLDYFHTHVCGAGASGCTSALGGAKVTGRSTTPGRLSVGVLVPIPGTWRLFLQFKANGHAVTAPFTLRVR